MDSPSYKVNSNDAICRIINKYIPGVLSKIKVLNWLIILQHIIYYVSDTVPSAWQVATF